MKRLFTLVALLLAVATTSAQEVVRTTHHYATHDGFELLLDRYDTTTPCEECRPCMIFAFGGGFKQGSRDNEMYISYLERLAAEGIVAISIDYRLGLKLYPPTGGKVSMVKALANAVNVAVEDLYGATNYIIANAKEWGINPELIMISGSSAGAITVLQAEWLRSNGDRMAEVLPEGFRYAGVVSCAGAIFSTKGKPKFRREAAPMLLFHGTSDSNVPYHKSSIAGIGFFGSKHIAKQLDKVLSPYYFYSAEYVTHTLAATPFIDQQELILQFINDYVLRGRKLYIEAQIIDPTIPQRPTRFTPMDYIRTNYGK
ncbi:MAG: alpha/beta hydrolase [Alistipes sp.]|nr:alpha/beta hydrolase [Alistipes sp.]